MGSHEGLDEVQHGKRGREVDRAGSHVVEGAAEEVGGPAERDGIHKLRLERGSARGAGNTALDGRERDAAAFQRGDGRAAADAYRKARAQARERERLQLDWQPLYGHLRQRLSPAFLNSTGLMYPSFECSLKLLYQWT